MVGEIRDMDTAEIAIKAAQTGHLVLSTLHTNDAPQTLTRLANMGIPAFNIASSVNLIVWRVDSAAVPAIISFSGGIARRVFSSTARRSFSSR